MGLDIVEIIMRTEESFGIEIPNGIAAQLVTPAALADFVATRVPLEPSGACLSRQLFHQLRRALLSRLQVRLPTFDLDTPLGEILDGRAWPEIWEAIRVEAGQHEWPTAIPWPGLVDGGAKTVRELIWYVVASLPKRDVPSGQAWTREQIRVEIRRIVSDQAGIYDYRLHDRFVEEIGLD